MANSDLVQSVVKALDVLKYIASCPDGCKLCDLAAYFNMKPPALHNILRTMVDREFLAKTPAGVYYAGEALHEIADRLPDRMEKLEKMMLHLRDLYPEAVITLAELTSHAVACTRRISPDEPGLIQIPANRSCPPYSGVTGLVALSFSGLTAEELETRWPFEEFGAAEWPDKGAWESAMSQCRENGFAMRRRFSVLTLAVPLSGKRTLGICLPPLNPLEENQLLKTVQKLTGGMA